MYTWQKKQFSPGAEYFLVYIMKVTFELATASYFIHSDEYTTPCPTYYSPVCRQLAYKSSVWTDITEYLSLCQVTIQQKLSPQIYQYSPSHNIIHKNLWLYKQSKQNSRQNKRPISNDVCWHQNYCLSKYYASKTNFSSGCRHETY